MTSSDLAGRRVALIGNVGPDSPPFSTENEWVRAYEHHGIEVSPFCERNLDHWDDAADQIEEFDWVHWTSTPPWRLALDRDMIKSFLTNATLHSTPVVGIHLDRFWNIPEREHWITSGDPYFYVDLLCTADGASEERWEQAGINHRWLLPGVGESYCHRGKVRDEYEADIAFVGSWRSYHRESRHRREMLSQVQRRFTDVKLWPVRRQPAIRGDDLTDLYWSTKVVVGDSYFESRNTRALPPPNYSSDRVPESLGRGAMLIHPAVEGITDGPFNTPNLTTYPAWGWGHLRRAIEESLDLSAAARTKKRNAGIKHIKAHHTYEIRATELVVMMREEGLL